MKLLFIQLTMTRRVTQKQIAAAAKVHPSTVCLALAGSSRLPAETRARVKAIATKLGYAPDPMLGALAAYRRASRRPAFHGVVAWVVNSAGNYNWRAVAQYRAYLSGAQERAKSLGYQVELFDLADYHDHPRRLNGILRARNIRGVLICPQPEANALVELNFDDLSAVTLGYTVRSPVLHLATSHHIYAMRQVLGELRARGYRRIGYAIPSGHNARVDGNYMAGFLCEQDAWPADERVRPLVEEPRIRSFRDWLAAEEPDAVVVPHYGYAEFIRTMGIKMPDQLGVAVVSLVDELAGFAGHDEDAREVGRVAVGFLASMVERGETGLPSRPQRILVRGIWREGTTLRPRQS